MTKQVDRAFWDQPKQLDGERWQDYVVRLRRFREQYVEPIKGEHYIDYLIRWKWFYVKQQQIRNEQLREKNQAKKEKLIKAKRKTKIRLRLKPLAHTNAQS
jgi:hypothetical protein